MGVEQGADHLLALDYDLRVPEEADLARVVVVQVGDDHIVDLLRLHAAEVKLVLQVLALLERDGQLLQRGRGLAAGQAVFAQSGIEEYLSRRGLDVGGPYREGLKLAHGRLVAHSGPRRERHQGVGVQSDAAERQKMELYSVAHVSNFLLFMVTHLHPAFIRHGWVEPVKLPEPCLFLN